MKEILLTYLFLLNLTFGICQKGADPFELKSYETKEYNIKSIIEYDNDSNEIKHGKYDKYGNQVYYREEDRIIEFELNYDQNGYLEEEVAIGFRNSLVLNKLSFTNNKDQIDSIRYILPIPPYISGFAEKYNYNVDGKISNIIVYDLSHQRTIFQHNYTYNTGNMLNTIHTFAKYDQDSVSYFTKYYSYYQNGNILSSSQIANNGDTIAIRFFNKKGLLINEIISPHYTTPHKYLFSAKVYSEVLSDLNTPLTPFLICKNIKKEDHGQKQLLFYIIHQYEDTKLLSSITSAKNKEKEVIVSTDSYRYNDQNEKIEHSTITNYNHDTSIVNFNSGTKQRYIYLSQKSRSYVTIKELRGSDDLFPELTIESFYNKWECKTTTHYDSTKNTVTKKKYCLNPEGFYPSKPENTTIATFDLNERLINHRTFFEAKKAPNDKIYSYSKNGLIIKYEINGEYWKYHYSADDSMLVKQENYSDSTYLNLFAYYTYKYDYGGNYTVKLSYLDEDDIYSNNPVFQYFDSEGKILRKEWINSEGKTTSKMDYIYNELGLCKESVFVRGENKNVTKYKYEYY